MKKIKTLKALLKAKAAGELPKGTYAEVNYGTVYFVHPVKVDLGDGDSYDDLEDIFSMDLDELVAAYLKSLKFKVEVLG
jgi:hypothetical protein